MKVSVATLQGIAPHKLGRNGYRVSVDCPLISTSEDDHHRGGDEVITAALSRDLRGSIERSNADVLERWQKASQQVLSTILNHSYKQSTDLLVVRGLIISDGAINLLERFSNVMTSIIISPYDPNLLLSDQLRTSLEKGADVPNWLVTVVGSNGLTSTPVGSNSHAVRTIVKTDRLSQPIKAHLTIPDLPTRAIHVQLTPNCGLEVSGNFGRDAFVRAGSLTKSAHFDHRVERIIDFDLDSSFSTVHSLNETVIVRSNLDPVLDVAASGVLSDTVNETISDRLKTLSSKQSPAPAGVKNTAAMLQALIESRFKGTAKDSSYSNPPLIILNGTIFSAEECIYVSLKALSKELEAEQQAAYPNAVAEIERAINAALIRRRELSPVIHPNLLDATDLPGVQQSGYEYAFHASLGVFDGDQAKAVLPRQLDVLRLLADMGEDRIQIAYKAETRLDPVSELPGNVFYIAVRYLVCEDADERRALQKKAQAVGALLHSVFTDVYSMNFGEHPPLAHRSRWIDQSGLTGTSSVTVRMEPNGSQAVSPDWGLFFGYTLENARPAQFEMILSAGNDGFDAAASSELSLDDGEADVLNSHELFRGISSDQSRRFTLSAELSAVEEDLDILQFMVANQFGLTRTDAATSPAKVHLSPLAAITRFHPPYESMPRSGTERRALQLSVPGLNFPTTGVGLGRVTVRRTNVDRDKTARLADRDRLRHLYVLGRTGSGKTNLLKHLAEQDIAREGQGITVIDPHGDLAAHVLSTVPWERVKNDQVVSLDFSRRDFLPILNPLYRGMDIAERDRTVQTLLKLLEQRVYHEYTGPRFEELLRICFATILHDRYPDTPSILQIPRLLTDSEYRRRIVNAIDDPAVASRWQFHDSQRGDRDFASTLDWAVSKFTDLLEDETLRLTLSGGERSVDFDSILKLGKVLVVTLPEGVIGPETSEFIGSLVVAQLRLAAFRVGAKYLVERGRSHFTYIDEFQRFALTDIGSLVAEGRKFGVGFILAHQNLDQLRGFSPYSGGADSSLLSAILGNVGNVAVFRVGSIDAPKMEEQLALSTGSLIRLKSYEAVCSVLVDGHDVGPFTLAPPLVTSLANPRNSARIEMNMKAVGREWRSMDELRTTAAPSAIGHAESSNSDLLLKARRGPESESFLDEWLAKRRRVNSTQKRPLTPFLPRVPRTQSENRDYREVIDDWLSLARTPPGARGSEGGGGAGKLL